MGMQSLFTRLEIRVESFLDVLQRHGLPNRVHIRWRKPELRTIVHSLGLGPGPKWRGINSVSWGIFITSSDYHFSHGFTVCILFCPFYFLWVYCLILILSPLFLLVLLSFISFGFTVYFLFCCLYLFRSLSVSISVPFILVGFTVFFYFCLL